MSRTDENTPLPAPTTDVRTVAVQHRRLQWLESLRALAACYVVLHHIPIILSDYFAKQRIPFGVGIGLLLNFGHMAVDVFIVLSGFALMLPIVSGKAAEEPGRAYRLRGATTGEGIRNFLLARGWRILPPYYFSMILAGALIALGVGDRFCGVVWQACREVTLSGVLLHLFLLQDLFPSAWGQINCVFWSISLEFRIYLLFPLFLWLCRRFGMLSAALIAFVVSEAVSYFVTFVHVIDAPIYAHYLGLFAGGALCCDLVYGPLRRRLGGDAVATPLRRALAIAGVFVCLLVTLALWYKGRRELVYDPFVGLGTMCLLFALATKETGKLRRAFEWRPLVFLGSFAYSIYLVHFPILQVVFERILLPLNLPPLPLFIAMLIVGVSAALLISYLFFLACERPFHKIARRFSGGRPAKGAGDERDNPPPKPAGTPTSPVSPAAAP